MSISSISSGHISSVSANFKAPYETTIQAAQLIERLEKIAKEVMKAKTEILEKLKEGPKS